jgi:hypothetical protein
MALRKRLLVLAAASASACGLVITGSGSAPLATDAAVPDSDVGDASIDAGGDAAVGVGACGDGGIMLALSFGSTADLQSFVTRAGNSPGPSTDPDAGVTLLRSTDLAARDSIWFANPVPLDTFDVTFETLVTCPDAGYNCGDGIAFAWLDAPSVDAAFAGGVGGGSSFGVPDRVGGNAVAVDLARGSPPPTLEILRLDSGLSAGTYPWVVSGVSAAELGSPAWNTVVITVRNGHAVVSGGGLQLEAGVAPLARGMFGLTAATGDDVAGFKVRNLHASFGCAPAP